MEDLTRRGFVGGMGMMSAMGMMGAMGVMPAFAASEQSGDSASSSASTSASSSASASTSMSASASASASSASSAATSDFSIPQVTPDTIEKLGGSTVSIYELNKKRHELVDSKGDYTCEDGTVIPAVYTKLRALTNTYLVGCGSEVNDTCFDFFKMNFTEDEAQAYLDMPFGVVFTAADYAAESGRDEDECLELCEDLASRGLLARFRRAGVAHFHQLALAHGFFEYGLNNYFEDGWTDNYRHAWTSDYAVGYMDSGTPFYYSVPVDKAVVADEQVLPLDDYEKVIDRNTTIAVSPCQCRKIGMYISGEDEPPAVGSDELKDFMAPCGHPLETCLSFGEQAEYYIENGIGRQIDQDEARNILKRSVDAGMILQSAYTKDSYVICSCHSDCCRILGVYIAAGADACAKSNTFTMNTSHYTLNYDKDKCIKCGACMERCPMSAITMDDDGYPTVSALCMRCGQCGTVCPVGARTLVAKDADKILDKPEDLLGDYNLVAGYRFEHGTIY